MSQLKTNNKTKIVNWSGGSDSTACLIDLLYYTEDEVIAYHFAVTQNDNKEYVGEYNFNRPVEHLEYQAVQKLTPILKQQYRDFEVRVVTISTPQTPYNYYEMGLFPILAAIEQGAEYYSGRCLEDNQTWERVGVPVYHFVERRHKIEQACHVPIILYNKQKSKKQIRKDIGEKIWKLTWSCDFPTSTNKPCGTCSKCTVNKTTKSSRKKKSSKGE